MEEMEQVGCSGGMIKWQFSWNELSLIKLLFLLCTYYNFNGTPIYADYSHCGINSMIRCRRERRYTAVTCSGAWYKKIQWSAKLDISFLCVLINLEFSLECLCVIILPHCCLVRQTKGLITSGLCPPFVPTSKWAPKYFIERDVERRKTNGIKSNYLWRTAQGITCQLLEI
jgi:hypothetical protein